MISQKSVKVIYDPRKMNDFNLIMIYVHYLLHKKRIETILFLTWKVIPSPAFEIEMLTRHVKLSANHR